jgi:hypothetical protein
LFSLSQQHINFKIETGTTEEIKQGSRTQIMRGTHLKIELAGRKREKKGLCNLKFKIFMMTRAT